MYCCPAVLNVTDSTGLRFYAHVSRLSAKVQGFHGGINNRRVDRCGAVFLVMPASLTRDSALRARPCFSSSGSRSQLLIGLTVGNSKITTRPDARVTVIERQCPAGTR